MATNRDGATYQGQKVLHDGEAVVRAINESEMEHISATESGAYSWCSSFATGGTDVEVMSIVNNHATKVLVIEDIIVGAAAACVFTIGHIVSGAPAGTTLVPTCLNRDSVKDGTAISTSFGNAAVTGTVVVNPTYCYPTVANTPFEVPTEGANILGNGGGFAVSASANTTVYVTIVGYFAELADL